MKTNINNEKLDLAIKEIVNKANRPSYLAPYEVKIAELNSLII